MALAAHQIRTVGAFPPVATTGSEIPIVYISTNDNEAAIEATGWANLLAKIARVGSPVFILADLDGTPGVLCYQVTAISAAGVVTIAQRTFASTV